MNQYAGTGNTQFGQFGHVYQQIGVSGEPITDRELSGVTDTCPLARLLTVLEPREHLGTNMIMCAYGLDAALGGADLEVGAGFQRWKHLVA